jgi:hypothetical protein
MEKIMNSLQKKIVLLIGVIVTGSGKRMNLIEMYGLDLIPKLDWEFFFGWNIAKPMRDFLYGYVPEGYDQQAEEEAYRNRNREKN